MVSELTALRFQSRNKAPEHGSLAREPIMILAIVAVWTAEALNTALEFLTDIASSRTLSDTSSTMAQFDEVPDEVY